MERDISGSRLFTGILTKGEEKLYTAWWYDDGSLRTNSQFAWRWHSLKSGKDFSVVNVTTDDEEKLEKEVREIMGRNVFGKVLKQG